MAKLQPFENNFQKYAIFRKFTKKYSSKKKIDPPKRRNQTWEKVQNMYFPGIGGGYLDTKNSTQTILVFEISEV